MNFACVSRYLSHPCRVLLLPVILALVLVSSSGATVPPGFSSSVFAGALNNPTAMDFAPDGRLFVCEQGGALRVVKNGALLAKPFITLPVDSDGERGLLGVAFDPAFASNNYVYVYYTSKTPATHNRVSRFTASGDTASSASELILLELDNLSGATNHNGGAIHFGPDSMLYIAAGDNAASANAQTLGNLLGKILRIHPNGSIPLDNPFNLSATGNNRAIWCMGLRNPFTFAFQPGTGKLFINDVGQSTWEEINFGLAGANYGWPTTEGYTTNPLFKSPVFAYPHGPGTAAGVAITGGAFYSPDVQQFPASYAGDYFFADYGNGWINVLHLADSSVTNFGSGLGSVVDIKVRPDGSLYYLTTGGTVTRITYNTNGVRTVESPVPTAFALRQNFPNPFNPSTVIRFSVASEGRVGLQVFNLLGEHIASLVDEWKSAGSYEVTFDAGRLPSGVYLYQLASGNALLTKRMIFIR
jgi:glucose/arabinose dehydrogenase